MNNRRQLLKTAAWSAPAVAAAVAAPSAVASLNYTIEAGAYPGNFPTGGGTRSVCFAVAANGDTTNTQVTYAIDPTNTDTGSYPATHFSITSGATTVTPTTTTACVDVAAQGTLYAGNYVTIVATLGNGRTASQTVAQTGPK